MGVPLGQHGAGPARALDIISARAPDKPNGPSRVHAGRPHYPENKGIVRPDCPAG